MGSCSSISILEETTLKKKIDHPAQQIEEETLKKNSVTLFKLLEKSDYSSELNIRKILCKGISLHHLNNGETLLHTALKYNHCKFGYEYIQHLTDDFTLNHQDSNGNTPLHLALSHNKLDEKLISQNNLNVQNNLGQTPLHIFLEYFHQDFLENNLDHNWINLVLTYTNINILDNTGTFPIQIAIIKKFPPTILKLLITPDNVKCVDENNNTLIHLYFQAGSYDKDFIHIHKDFSKFKDLKNSSGYYPLDLYMRQFYILNEILNDLISKNNINNDCNGNCALQSYLKKSCIKTTSIIKALSSQTNIDYIDRCGNSPLSNYLSGEKTNIDIDILNTLLSKNNVDYINKNRDYPIHIYMRNMENKLDLHIINKLSSQKSINYKEKSILLMALIKIIPMNITKIFMTHNNINHLYKYNFVKLINQSGSHATIIKYKNIQEFYPLHLAICLGLPSEIILRLVTCNALIAIRSSKDDESLAISLAKDFSKDKILINSINRLVTKYEKEYNDVIESKTDEMIKLHVKYQETFNCPICKEDKSIISKKWLGCQEDMQHAICTSCLESLPKNANNKRQCPSCRNNIKI